MLQAEANIAHTQAKAVFDEVNATVGAAREHRIALNHQFWNSTKESLQRIQKTQAPIMAS